MTEQNPVALSEEDLVVLALLEQANQQYQVYLELMKSQMDLATKGPVHVEQPRTWDYPLGLVIRSKSNAGMERLVE